MKEPRNIVRLASRERARLSRPLTYDWLDHDFAKDPGPLIEALHSDAPLPKHLRDVLIDLFERYRLVFKRGAKWIPSYRRLSDAEAKLAAAAEEYRALGMGGPITSKEMDAAVRLLEARAKRKGRGRVQFIRVKAAQQLRRERIARLAAGYDLTPKKLENFLKGRRGSSRR